MSDELGVMGDELGVSRGNKKSRIIMIGFGCS
jgi:hypothetical protein